MIQLPASVGKYELLEFLGGGMSHVYRARDTVIDRAVVVKILTDESSSDPESKARFLQEAKLAGNIQHENIVSVFDYGEHDGHPYIVMEYLKGEDLRGAIRGARVGSIQDRLKVALDIAKALDYVHGRSVVHRDIKPENIHIDPTGRVKLMDFGIAKTADLSLTKTGMAMGTPYYMAPEQVSGGATTTLVDVYAFGLVFYELITGVRAVNGEGMEHVFYQILYQTLDETAMENAGAPPAVRSLILRCTAKNPEQRPQSFQRIVEELRGLPAPTSEEKTRIISTLAPVLTTAPLQAPAQPKTHPPPKKSRLAVWIGGVVLIAVIVAVVLLRPHPVPEIPGMVFIPAGQFLYGPNKTPAQLGAFYIDETEVSTADYCKVTGCPVSGDGDLPIVNVTVTQARDYAKKVGKRLPNAMEWERAARGTQGALFPWGNEFDPSKANVKDNRDSKNERMPVRSFSGPPYNMIGNVWEMIEGTIQPSEGALKRFPQNAGQPWITTRGGSYLSALDRAFSYDGVNSPEGYAAPDLGFRLVKDVPKD